jgi:hypothetical protein
MPALGGEPQAMLAAPASAQSAPDTRRWRDGKEGVAVSVVSFMVARAG